MHPDIVIKPLRTPLWSGRPTAIGGCARCQEVKHLLGSLSKEPDTSGCSDCQSEPLIALRQNLNQKLKQE